jgi:catechol 2,3-dioxygenase-like lactoylglutathione lyase family enzyme
MSSYFSGVDTVIIRVRDITAATGWYVTHLGADPVYEDEDQRLAVLEFPSGSTITLWQLDAGATWSASSTYPILATDDARGAHAALAAAGVAVEAVHETPGVLYFRFRDADGNALEACELKE